MTDHEFVEQADSLGCLRCGVRFADHPRRPERAECPYCHNTIDVRAGRYEHHTVVGGPCSGSRQVIQSQRGPDERVPTSTMAAGLIADFNQGAREQVAWEAEQARLDNHYGYCTLSPDHDGPCGPAAGSAS